MSQVPQQVAGNLCCTVYMCYCVQCSLYTSIKAYILIKDTDTLSVFWEVVTVGFLKMFCIRRLTDGRCCTFGFSWLEIYICLHKLYLPGEDGVVVLG